MSKNYAIPLPTDGLMNTMQNYPSPKIANAQYASENGNISSVISLNANTTTIEIVAVTAPAVIKWIATGNTGASVVATVAGANFDHTVVIGESRRFVVPIETYPTASVLATQAGANLRNGLYQRVAIKTLGTGSVLLAEY